MLILWQELIVVFAKVLEGADHGAADAGQLWSAIEDDGVYATYLEVDIRLLTLILKVLDGAYTLDNTVATMFLGKVHGEACHAHYLNTLVIGIDSFDLLDALVSSEHTSLLLINANSDDEFVGKAQRTVGNVLMSYREWIE